MVAGRGRVIFIDSYRYIAFAQLNTSHPCSSRQPVLSKFPSCLPLLDISHPHYISATWEVHSQGLLSLESFLAQGNMSILYIRLDQVY